MKSKVWNSVLGLFIFVFWEVVGGDVGRALSWWDFPAEDKLGL